MKNIIKRFTVMAALMAVLFPLAAKVPADFVGDEKPAGPGVYTVYHFQQKVSGGKNFADYVLTGKEKHKVIATAEEATLEKLKKTYTGFKAKEAVPKGNAIYVFYNRKVISYTFKTGKKGSFEDGTTEKVLKGLYGAQVPVSPKVSSSTHSFNKWIDSEKKLPPSSFGEKNITFAAQWLKNASTGNYNWYEIPLDAETGEKATKNSKYVYFGFFPKTVLPKDSSVVVDETEGVVMGPNTYYRGNDGNLYVKITENGYDSDYIYSDGSKVEKSSAVSIRYFKVEPIKWKVLTTDYNGTGKALLLAEDILTANVQYYNDNSFSNTRTVGSDTNIYHNNYKYSQIRAYLNGLDYYYDTSSSTTTKKTDYTDKGFLQTAFTTSAQAMIAETTVDNSASSTTDAGNNISKAIGYACEDTTDKIFLLSEKEVTTTAYGFAAYDSYGTGSARIRVTTDYARANYAYQSTTEGYGGYWWLRSPYYYSSDCARYVSYDGRAYSDYRVDDTRRGVVPALSIAF